VLVDVDTVVEAQPHGAQKASKDNYPNAVWSNFLLNDVQRAAIVQWSLDHVGTPYNFLDIVALFFSRVLHIKFGWVNTRLSQNGTDICSQLVDAAYRAAGVHLFHDGRPSGDVTPEDLHKEIQWTS
jgi:uncharacterized protein YycO